MIGNVSKTNPAWGHMQRILATLGFETDDPWGQSDFTITTVRRAVLAYEEMTRSEFQSRGGAWNPKTKKRRDQEAAIFQEWCLLLSDHPNHPLGAASGGVHMEIRDAVEKEEARAAQERATPPPLPTQLPTVVDGGLVLTQDGSAWEKVSVDDEWVAQIHHEKGARDWDIHFRANIPLETYSTRKECVEALKARFVTEANDG